MSRRRFDQQDEVAAGADEAPVSAPEPTEPAVEVVAVEVPAPTPDEGPVRVQTTSFGCWNGVVCHPGTYLLLPADEAKRGLASGLFLPA